MEEAGISLPTPESPVLIPGRMRSSPPSTFSATSTSSRRRRHHHGPSSSPTATAVSPESPTSAASPAAAEFPAGFGSRPGRHRCRKTVAIGVFRVGASNPFTEGPPAMVSSRLFSPELGDGHSACSAVLQLPVQPPAPSWIQAGQEEMKKFMKERCCGFVLHLMDHPEDLDLVHSVLQADFIVEGWLDAPAPLSAGGPFDPLLVAVKAAKPLDSEPQPAAAGLQSLVTTRRSPWADCLHFHTMLRRSPWMGCFHFLAVLRRSPWAGCLHDLVQSTCLVSSGGCYWNYGLML
ncbi:hypothetical protein AMECASPLE_038773 [Ameca splendens]|uniref:Uncharacterized protein n=1 Tax=Ameca splendens TaxID=208324 RepID=A0ABV0Z740_9TELE